MISRDISNKVLTIGCEFTPPKGGVAQVLHTYHEEVYENFHFIANSCEGTFIQKILILLWAYVQTFFILLVCREIRIVHIHTASYNSFKRSTYFVSLAKFLRRKVIIHIHGGGFRDYFKTNSNWILKQLHRADCVLALTDNWRKFFTGELCLQRVVTVPNIIPFPQLCEPQSKDGRIHLLFLGFIIEQKGIFDLIEVINEHKQEWRGKLMLHVGGSHEVNRLQQYISTNELEDLIHYEGWVTGEKKIELFNLIDAYILPSYVEGMPISILEALSYGKPVITTPVGGIPEVINEENGFLFSPGDKKEMATLIERIIHSPSILNNKSNKAKMSVDKHFPYAIANVLDDVYKRLI